jgi:hypothetical protein
VPRPRRRSRLIATPAKSPAGTEGTGADGRLRAAEERAMGSYLVDYQEQNKNNNQRTQLFSYNVEITPDFGA